MFSQTHTNRFLSALACVVIMGGIVTVTKNSTLARNTEEARTRMTERHIVAMQRGPVQRAVVNLRDAIEQRQELLKRSVTVSFATPNQTEPLAKLSIVMAEVPAWIVFETEGDTGKAAVSEERILQHLLSFPIDVPTHRSCTVVSTSVDEHGVERAQTDCTSKSGYFYDTALVAGSIKKALQDGMTEITYPLTEIRATLSDPSISVEPLKLLSTGRSTFKGSGAGRKANVRKVLNERLHNVVVPAGAEFSFNDTLGKVTLRNGWQMALTIFEGGNLRLAPGGGICQGSTTMYRAALDAGLPITEQRNHSIYVAYYEAFRVGQDATVFPGHKDFMFLNDTGGPIVIQAYNDGDEAFVNLYGFDDGRAVTISGPYFSSTMPENFLEGGKKIRGNEIGWQRIVTLPGSEPKTETFVSRYKAIPKSLLKTWTATIQRVRSPLVAELLADR